MTFDQTLQAMAEHYARLRMNPATAEHARHMVALFAQDECFAELPALAKQEVKKLQLQAVPM